MTLVGRRDPALERCASGPLVVLTGAGLSTDSGIPDYRGPGAPARMPMTYQEFVSGPAAQQRYWARSHLGWSRMRRAEPNAGHRAVAALGADLVVTQNVDGLHEAAGTRDLVALHGRIADVVCLACRRTTPRATLQQRLEDANPGWAARHADVTVRPDGDVDLEETADFVVPACADCGGPLKPDVVFFGENVPKPRVERCYAAVEALAATGGTLLVAGSSLTVMSGLRFVRRAAQRGIDIVILNRGATRGDDLATHKVEAGTSEWLTALADVRLRAS
ncbi:Sir2 family NAD-dependent protein deacetylase [Nocardioides sp. QY071]|uniref:Sir2 family NAD-dependent protein deacetylase n=1 Tax=Nocardioides sp. QY071 TaxID=3044187 RepID=UPI00249C3F4B|nr:Sir2 family NAD-dependent protein deacetylase [Nocardioides sp. QY071]WGY02818.1 Sir2 family NAD-dependent protein deacetylase [Nocardioides sp. QY071]